ncbi:molecular chaperone DnaK [Candidatus Woesearchaeota archaeon]|nr:molecular chaperone DnaK [Candidatus Woesearchaeota archaeon]
MSKTIGVDLGTSNSAAAIMQAGRPIMIPSSEGSSLYGKAFPSVVAFNNKGEVFVGEPARRQAISNPSGTITAAKRKMGTSFKYDIQGKQYKPEQISAFILQKIKKDAEAFLGEKVEKAVITVPAYFNDDQRQATKDAGTIAGLEVVRIVNEPTAASLAYGLDKKNQEMKILVFDLGGGTLDVTIMEFGDSVFEVKSTSGDTQLGGTDMDVSIMNYIIKEFEKETGIDLNDDETAMQRVREAAEKAKIELSTTMETEINLPFISAGAKGPKHLQLKISRSKLEEIVDHIVQRCKKPVEQAMRDAKLSKNDIAKVIMVGGPTRMPIVRKFVKEILGKEPEGGVDPMECVAMGAAIQAGVLSGEVKDILLLDVTPLTLGIETLGGIRTPLIQRNTTIPTKKSQTFSTAADNQPAVTVHVLQGEREMASDNKSLGTFELTGIPPAPRGIPQIEVTFDIDANGILSVSAKDMGTGKEQTIKITASQKLKDEDIERMKKEAEKFAEDDKKRKENIETKNNSDSLIYSTEKILEEYKDKIDADTREKVSAEIKELKEAIAKDDFDKMKRKFDDLQKKAQEIGTKMYQQNKPEGHEDSEHKGKKKKDNTVDAEVVDEEK